jgi:hypothetical protein
MLAEEGEGELDVVLVEEERLCGYLYYRYGRGVSCWRARLRLSGCVVLNRPLSRVNCE